MREVKVDGLLAQVELEAGPFRIVSVITSEAARELGLEPGIPGDGGRQGNLDHGRAVRALAVLLSLAALAVPAATGAGGGLTVFAAASLTQVFPRIDRSPHYSFAGSDQLALQIRQGAPADVYAAASPKYPQLLYHDGLVSKPVTFATNKLIVLVPKSNPARLTSIYDLRRSGVKVVIGDRGVPIGAYTRQLLDTLGITDDVMRNVVSQEDRREEHRGQGRARRGRCRLRLCDGRQAGRLAGTQHQAPRLGPAAHPLPDRRGQLDPAQGRGESIHPEGDLESWPSAAEASRVRRASPQAMSRALFAVGIAVAAAVAFMFLLLPILAIFLRVPVGDLIGALGNGAAQDALVVSLKTSAIAHVAVLVFGTPTAYLLARRRFPGRGAVLTLVELPLVLPPAVAGIGLLVAFGRFGLLGDELSALGIQIGFTQAAVVLAVAFVESPFYLRGAVAAFEGVDTDLLAAARTLGAGPWRVFIRVALPLAAGGLGAASALALARGLGSSARRSSSPAASRG